MTSPTPREQPKPPRSTTDESERTPMCRPFEPTILDRQLAALRVTWREFEHDYVSESGVIDRVDAAMRGIDPDELGRTPLLVQQLHGAWCDLRRDPAGEVNWLLDCVETATREWAALTVPRWGAAFVVSVEAGGSWEPVTVGTTAGSCPDADELAGEWLTGGVELPAATMARLDVLTAGGRRIDSAFRPTPYL